MQRCFNIRKARNITHINRLKNKFYEMQEILLNLMKTIYNKPKAIIIRSREEEPKSIPFKKKIKNMNSKNDSKLTVINNHT